MRYIPNTPEGTRDRLFAECQQRREIETALTGLFARRGYSEIITPEEEFYDLFTGSGSAMEQEEMVKLIDRSGKICVLRPDCTTPIARVAATRLKDMPFPQRFFYDQTVYRSGQEHMGQLREIPQCGIELIGAKGERADLEVIATAVDALRACGLEQFHIELGHADIFPALASQLSMTREELERMRSLIEGKNYAALNDFLGRFGEQPGCQALQRLAYLFGGAEVLDEAEALAGPLPAISYLRRLYQLLDQSGYGRYIRFDLGLVHHLDYYTGPVFRGYAEGAGEAVLSGGRYDQLCGVFGRSAAAAGFAIHVDAVGRCLPEPVPAKVSSMVWHPDELFTMALRYVESCTPGSCELSTCATLEDTIQLANERGIRKLVILSPGKVEEVDIGE
ncbi:MAG: ATP phosphoribosyltransferase regulatory subunit [Oscillospiraceae bacterium]|nr:ATP phosphoribosyltransferase regulatory subunit [Oscillospiraceae bacterium]